MRQLHATRSPVAAPRSAYTSPSVGRQMPRFAVHVLQMCAVMCISVVLLGLLVAGAAAVFGFSDPRQSAPVLSAVVVTLTLAGAMVAWMRFMAMGWQPTLEMSGATVLAGAVMIVGYAVGAVPASRLTTGVCCLACVLMIADMLLHFRLYASHPARHARAT